MIITLTLNPALDKTATIEPLVAGGLNRIQTSEIDAGGKGINVSKIIDTLGGKSMATGFVGGSTGEALLRMLDDLGLEHKFVRAQGITRINLKLLDAVNGITEVNDPGIIVSPQEEDALLQLLEGFITQNELKPLVVLAGSMHAKAKPTFYGELTTKLKTMGAKVFVDADGEAFVHALEAGPDFVKPNKEELLKYFKLSSNENISIDQLIKLCKEIVHSKKVGMVALSMGHEGAIFVTKDKCAVASALKVSVSSTVGAGDSMVGALAHAFVQDYGFDETIRLAMAASAGAVTTKGTKAPSIECINTLVSQVVFEYK